MNSIATSIVIIPGVVALLLCLLFTYLHQQSRQAYFRAWQVAWACYTVHYALDAFRYFYPPAPVAFFFSSLFSVAMGVSIFISTRLIRESFRLRWYDWALALAGAEAYLMYAVAPQKDVRDAGQAMAQKVAQVCGVERLRDAGRHVQAFVQRALALVSGLAQQHDRNVPQVVGVLDAAQDLQPVDRRHREFP